MTTPTRRTRRFAEKGPRLSMYPGDLRRELNDYDARTAARALLPPTVTENLAAIPVPGTVAIATVNLTPLRSARKATLSPREREIVLLLGRGYSTSQLRRLLWLSPHTIRNHIKAAGRYFGTRTQAATVGRAVALDIITPAELADLSTTPYPSGQGKQAATIQKALR